MKLSELFGNLSINYYYGQDSSVERDFSEEVDLTRIFLTLGMKEYLFNGLLGTDSFRINHSTSILYLGASIVKNLNLSLTIHVGVQEFEFNYYWSLLCLFHDLGYTIEKNKGDFFRVREENIRYQRGNQGNGFFYDYIQEESRCKFIYKKNFINSINQFIYTIQEDRYRHRNRCNREILNYEFVNRVSAIKFTSLNTEVNKSQYWGTTINSYYKYRENEFGCIDHGIIGGYLFFDRFLKNYINKMKESEHTEDFYDFHINNIYFKIEQIPLIAYISDCIVSHNVFLPKEDQIDMYENYDLKQLCKLPKVSFIKNPILFLFDFVDAIDPIKFFTHPDFPREINTILDSIDFAFCQLNKEINIVLDCSVFNAVEIKAYLDKVKDITNWLDILIEDITNGVKVKFTRE